MSDSSLELSCLLEVASRPRVRRLVAEHGSPAVARRVLGLKAPDSKRLRERLTVLDAWAVAWDEPAFPAVLTTIPDPPLLLYLRGERCRLQRPAVALVGGRRAGRLSLDLAGLLGRRLGVAGLSVVSGLAMGVDAAAHRGAVYTIGGSIAVLGSGVGRVQPAVNRPLADALLESGGLIVSEYAPDARAARHQFPERNRLISGLALGVVIIEASERSGSLITARHALDQGREVMAVPGAASSAGFRGSNRLIKQGAALIENEYDVLDALGFVGEPGPAPVPLSPDPAPSVEAAELLAELDGTPRSADALAEALVLTPQRALVLLTELELGGFVRRLPDGYARLP